MKKTEKLVDKSVKRMLDSAIKEAEEEEEESTRLSKRLKSEVRSEVRSLLRSDGVAPTARVSNVSFDEDDEAENRSALKQRKKKISSLLGRASRKFLQKTARW